MVPTALYNKSNQLHDNASITIKIFTNKVNLTWRWGTGKNHTVYIGQKHSEKLEND
jgi:hypothetical protein